MDSLYGLGDGLGIMEFQPSTWKLWNMNHDECRGETTIHNLLLHQDILPAQSGADQESQMNRMNRNIRGSGGEDREPPKRILMVESILLVSKHFPF